MHTFHYANSEGIFTFHFWIGSGEEARPQDSLCPAWQGGRVEVVYIVWAELPALKCDVGTVKCIPYTNNTMIWHRRLKISSLGDGNKGNTQQWSSKWREPPILKRHYLSKSHNKSMTITRTKCAIYLTPCTTQCIKWCKPQFPNPLSLENLDKILE